MLGQCWDLLADVGALVAVILFLFLAFYIVDVFLGLPRALGLSVAASCEGKGRRPGSFICTVFSFYVAANPAAGAPAEHQRHAGSAGSGSGTCVPPRCIPVASNIVLGRHISMLGL